MEYEKYIKCQKYFNVLKIIYLLNSDIRLESKYNFKGYVTKV